MIWGVELQFHTIVISAVEWGTESRPVLEAIRPPTKWVQRFLYWQYSSCSMELATHLHISYPTDNKDTFTSTSTHKQVMSASPYICTFHTQIYFDDI